MKNLNLKSKFYIVEGAIAALHGLGLFEGDYCVQSYNPAEDHALASLIEKMGGKLPNKKTIVVGINIPEQNIEKVTQVLYDEFGLVSVFE